MKKLAYSLLAILAVCSSSSAQIYTWTTPPLVGPPNGEGTPASFTTGDSSVWSLRGVASTEQSTASAWDVMTSSPFGDDWYRDRVTPPSEDGWNGMYLHTDNGAANWGPGNQLIAPNNVPAGTDAVHGAALQFNPIAVTGLTFSITGNATLGYTNIAQNPFQSGGPGLVMRIGTLSGGTFNTLSTQTLATTSSSDTFSINFGSIGALQNFALASGGAIAFQILNDGGLNSVSWNGFTGGASPLTITAVPEPTTWALLAAGLTTLLTFRRRRVS